MSLTRGRAMRHVRRLFSSCSRGPTPARSRSPVRRSRDFPPAGRAGRRRFFRPAGRIGRLHSDRLDRAERVPGSTCARAPPDPSRPGIGLRSGLPVRPAIYGEGRGGLRSGRRPGPRSSPGGHAVHRSARRVGGVGRLRFQRAEEPLRGRSRSATTGTASRSPSGSAASVRQRGRSSSASGCAIGAAGSTTRAAASRSTRTKS